MYYVCCIGLLSLGDAVTYYDTDHYWVNKHQGQCNVAAIRFHYLQWAHLYSSPMKVYISAKDCSHLIGAIVMAALSQCIMNSKGLGLPGTPPLPDIRAARFPRTIIQI